MLHGRDHAQQRKTVMQTKAMKISGPGYHLFKSCSSIHLWGSMLSTTVLFQFKPGLHRGLEERQTGGKKARAGQ
jgi:hypothetical protein